MKIKLENENFKLIFIFLTQYSKELSQQDASFEQPKLMLS